MLDTYFQKKKIFIYNRFTKCLNLYSMQIRFWNVLGISFFYKYEIPLELVKDSICDKFYFLYFLLTKTKTKKKKLKK